MRSLLLLVLGVWASLIANTSRADVIFGFDFDTATPGIQNSLSANAGATVNVNVLMQITGATRVTAFSFGVAYNELELEALSVDTSVRDGLAIEQVNPVDLLTPGIIRPFDAISVGSGVGSTFPGVVGTIVFTAKTNTTIDGADIGVQFQNAGDGVLNNTNQLLPLGVTPGDGGVFNVTITAVPEPTTWLFATVIAGFGAQRVRRHLGREKKSS